MNCLKFVKERKHAVFACFLIFICCACTGCKRTPEAVTKTDFVLDTFASVTVYDSEDKEKTDELLNSAFSLIKRYERLFSAEIEESDVSKINRSKGGKTFVSSETAELIDIALKYSFLSADSWQ